jgi:hypothetical protein
MSRFTHGFDFSFFDKFKNQDDEEDLKNLYWFSYRRSVEQQGEIIHTDFKGVILDEGIS